MKKVDRQLLDSYLYVPLKVSSKGKTCIIIIYGHQINNSLFINPKMKKERNIKDYVNVFNLTNTIEDNYINSYMWEITDFDAFVKSVEKIDLSEIKYELTACSNILNGEKSDLLNRLSILDEVQISTNYCCEMYMKDQESTIVINNNDNQVANILFKTIKNTVKELNQEDIDKVSGIIHDVITEHLSMDVNNSEEVNKLIKELEYKIIDGLPTNTIVGKIDINMEYILSEIQSFQQRMGEKEDGELQ